MRRVLRRALIMLVVSALLGLVPGLVASFPHQSGYCGWYGGHRCVMLTTITHHP